MAQPAANVVAFQGTRLLPQKKAHPCVCQSAVSRSRCRRALTADQQRSRSDSKYILSGPIAPILSLRSVKRRITCPAQQQQDPVRQARTTQEQTTKLLAELLQAPDTAATARAHVDAIDEEFFMVSSTYLDMARKEGNKEVCTKLEQVLKIAMEEKQKTLRPEIQLLNNLMAATTVPERERVLAQDDAQQALIMNNGYFFGLLDRMTSDVGRQPDNPRKQDLMDQLQQINKRTYAQRMSVKR